MFDFDGLIVDTEGAVFQAWQEVYEEHGQRLDPKVWGRIIGTVSDFDGFADLERRLARPLHRDAIDARRLARERELVEALPVLPGVHEWRDAAQRLGLKRAIASSSTRAWVEGHLRRLGLQDWDCIRTREDAARAKPEPDLYLAVLERLGLNASQAIAVEDSLNGLTAAKRAGLFCVAVPCSMTAHMDLGAADLQLTSLTERSLEYVLAIVEGEGAADGGPG
ncbi:MAG TPA: HAD-IA family hydrolase [Candidatus Limnocylindrales bacterium]|nr:HAD-IA family hydrolase [Candidatus Limnocylindrales bacterium]